MSLIFTPRASPPRSMSHYRLPRYEPSISWHAADGSILSSGEAVLGCVLVATVHPADLDAAADCLVLIRRSHPWAPLVIVVPELQAGTLTDAAALVQRTAARVLSADLTNWPEWRERLTDLSMFGHQFASMMRLQRPDLRLMNLEHIRRIASAGAGAVPFEDVVSTFGCSLRAVEARFHRSALPAPSEYHIFGRFVASITALATDPSKRVSDAICLSGYSDRTTFTRACRRRLGIAVSQARLRVPWEWIAYRMRLYGRAERGL